MALAPTDITVTKDDLGKLLGKTGPADAVEVERAYTEAVVLVIDAFRSAWREVPGAVADDCVLRVGRSVWDTRKTASGGGQVSTDGPPVPRAPRDPLATSQVLIDRYVIPL